MGIEKNSEQLNNILNSAFIDIHYEKFSAKIHKLQNEKRIIIYGAGGWGKMLLQCLRSYSIEVEAFFDKQYPELGVFVEAIPAYSAEACTLSIEQRKETLIILAVRVKRQEQITCYLKNMGFEKIITIDGLWYYSNWLNKLDLHNLLDYKKHILDSVLLWEDEKSRLFYVKAIEGYVTRAFDHSLTIEIEKQYFPDDIDLHKGYSKFVDCGAYTGDTMHALYHKLGAVKVIMGFEPDPSNFKVLTEFAAKNHSIADNILLYPFGIWSETKKVAFESEKGASSLISQDGQTSLQCVALDDVLFNVKPTFIKMDIEGAEYEALLGMKQLLSECKPDLAIAVYHDIKHLWEIPLLVQSFNLGYTFYLRVYEDYNQEIIMYATAR